MDNIIIITYTTITYFLVSQVFYRIITSNKKSAYVGKYPVPASHPSMD